MDQPPQEPPALIPVHPVSVEPGGRPLTPIHPAAAAILLFVDNLWNFADWAVVSWIITIPLSFLSVFVPTLVLQRSSRSDRWMPALGKAAVMGLVAAVPTSLTGTPVGMALLAWAGIEKWRR
jgi:hypothetical protein